MRRETKFTAGFTLLELLIAMGAGALIVLSVFYMYRAHYSSMMQQSAIIDLELNSRYTLNAISEQVKVAGYGLPEWYDSSLGFDNGNLFIGKNMQLGHSTLLASSVLSDRTKLFIPVNDKNLFSLNGRVLITVGTSYWIRLISARGIKNADTAFITVPGITPAWPGGSLLYPLERILFSADSGCFRMSTSAGALSGFDTLTLAEEIDSISYAFKAVNDTGFNPGIPSDLRDLEWVRIRVFASSTIKGVNKSIQLQQQIRFRRVL